MKITLNLPDKTVQSYLDHFNAFRSTNFQVNTLTVAQTEYVAKKFAETMVGEIVMRTDDHYGFETERMFPRLKNLSK
jgi:hypothetical protein